MKKKVVSLLLAFFALLALSSCGPSTGDELRAGILAFSLLDSESDPSEDKITKMADMAVCIIDTSKKAFDFTEWNESDGGYEKDFDLFGDKYTVKLVTNNRRITGIEFFLRNKSASDIYTDAEYTIDNYGSPHSVTLNNETSSISDVENSINNTKDTAGFEYMLDWTNITVNSSQISFHLNYSNSGNNSTIASYSFGACSSTTNNVGLSSEPSASDIESPIPEIKFVYGNFYWGMSKDEAQAIEKGSFVRDAGLILLYETTIFDLGARLCYIFNNNGELYSVLYSLEEDYTDYNLYLDDYENIHEVLIEKFGAPYKEAEEWTNDYYKNNPADYGLAISCGHLTKAATWDLEETDIAIMIEGIDSVITTAVMFRSKTVEEPDPDSSY